ncbi:hypothetical protein CRYPA_549 [uncultured Candidatus Thioglobus sp.]|nr:hypothetical protein CRYPA_549 [uncultured Candidatus Thioglobus sp.]
MSGSPVKKENKKTKFLGLTVDGRVRKSYALSPDEGKNAWGVEI